MPPRSAKKGSTKKPSPRSKARSLTPPVAISGEPLPSVEEEEKIPETQASPVAVPLENNGDAAEEKPIEPEEIVQAAYEGPSTVDNDADEGIKVGEAAGHEAPPVTVPPENNGEAKDETPTELEESVQTACPGPSTVDDVADEGIKVGEAAGHEVLASATDQEGLAAEMDTAMTESDTIEQEVKDPEANSGHNGLHLKSSPEAPEGDERQEVITGAEDATQNSLEINSDEGIIEKAVGKQTVVLNAEGTEAFGIESGSPVEVGAKNGTDDDSDGGEDEDEVDPSLYMNASMTERRRNKEFEIFVGGLDKEAVEDDLSKVLGEFGEVLSVRIVKHPVTQKSKGFAFVRYATVEQAKKALVELKDGTEIRGKHVGISASMDSDTLYIGNICNSWTKDQVWETLKGFGIESVEEIMLPDDPKKEGNSKGFAFLEFGSHSDAMAAFHRLRKPDAVFGCNRSARVAFAPYSMHPSEEAMSQVKSVYVEGIPLSWDEEKVKEICNQYGEVEKVQLSRNFSKSKRKDFGFVAFTSHESARACIQGINDADVGVEDVKMKASLAKPQRKGRLAKRGTRGGFKINENGEVLKEADQSKAKSKAKTKGKRKALSKSKGFQGKNFPKSEGKTVGGKNSAENQQKNVEPSKAGKRRRKSMGIGNATRSSKKARSDFGPVRFGSRRDPRFEPYASAAGHQIHGYAQTSGSMHQQSDLEPHAGYLPAGRRPNKHEHMRRRNRPQMTTGIHQNPESIYPGRYSNQPVHVVGGYDDLQRNIAGYTAGSGAQPYYTGYPAQRGYEAAYPPYPSTGAYPRQGPFY